METVSELLLELAEYIEVQQKAVVKAMAKARQEESYVWPPETPVQKLRNLIYRGEIDILDIPQETRQTNMFIYERALNRATHLGLETLYYHVKKTLENDMAAYPGNEELTRLYRERIVGEPWDIWERLLQKSNT